MLLKTLKYPWIELRLYIVSRLVAFVKGKRRETHDKSR